MTGAGDSLDALHETAVTAAREAGRILAAAFGGARTIEYKGGIDLVTDADRQSEAHLLAYLRSRHPDHSVLAEESGLSRGSGSGYRWLVDPLDGTTNYAHRVPHFCVSVAVEGPEGLLVGAVYDPLRDELFAAARGRGATLNGKTIVASDTQELKRAILCTGFPYDVHAHPEGPLGLLGRFLRQAQGIRRMGSAALDLAYVAAGRFDGYFEFGLKPWDTAAGALLVPEAGGAITRIDAEPFELRIGDVLACAPGVAGALQKECRTFLSELGYRPGTLEPVR